MQIASRTGGPKPGLVHHRPEEWAHPSRCFENVAEKIRKDGGRIIYGWTFHLRFVEHAPDEAYLFITHHAVWHSPDGSLVNVTPYPDDKHYPLPGSEQDFVFLTDTNAKPVPTKAGAASLPLEFFPLGDDTRLVEYVKQMNQEEQEKCRKHYDIGNN